NPERASHIQKYPDGMHLLGRLFLQAQDTSFAEMKKIAEYLYNILLPFFIKKQNGVDAPSQLVSDKIKMNLSAGKYHSDMWNQSSAPLMQEAIKVGNTLKI